MPRRILLPLLFAYLCTAPVLFAQEKRNPSAPAKSERKAPKAPAAPAAEQDGQLRDIEQSWMNSIHGNETPVAPPGADAGNDAAPPERSAPPETRSFRNPAGPADQPEAAAQAGDARPTPELFADGEEGPSFFSVVFRFLGMAALMILVLYAGLRMMRNRAGPLAGAGELVQVVATVPLMQGRFLQIVDLAGQLLVLGVSDSGVHLVQEIDDARVGDRIRLWQAERSRLPLPTGMLEQLTGVLKNADFKFWHNEGGRSTQPGFKEWLGKYAPSATQAPAATKGDGDTSGDQESLSRLLNSQRQKLSAMQRRSSPNS